MFQNVLLFIHLKMFKIGCMLSITYCNKPCITCCSVWHRTTTVHFVIFMWITSCKIIWVFAVNFLLAEQWCGLVVMCNVQHIVTNHTESQISQEWRAALPSPFNGGWLTSCQLYFLVPLSSFLAHLLALPNVYQNKSQHRKLTLEKIILLPLLLGLKPMTFRSQIQCSTTKLSAQNTLFCKKQQLTNMA